MTLQPPEGFSDAMAAGDASAAQPARVPAPPTTTPEGASAHSAQRALSAPPAGLGVVGGSSARLRKAVVLDRLASGYGYLNITWDQRGQGLDLIALQENSSVTVRGHSIAVDLSQTLGRVLIGTGTRGTMALRASELTLSNGATQVVVPILGGTSLGVWPRVSITRVDGFVVLRHELDPLSGVLTSVADAYGYDERTFLLAHTT